MKENNIKTITMKENNIDYGLLDNVKQPKLTQILIKLREVFVEYINETDRVNDKYGCICGQLSDNFINEYNKLTDIITRSMAAIMDTEINDTIRTNSGY